MIWPDLPYDEPVREDLDPFGGCTAIKGTKTGFFHTEQFGGRWWLVTPEGNAYFLLSMRAVPGRSAARLKAWGFNCSRSGSTRPDTAEAGIPYLVRGSFLRKAPPLPLPAKAGFPPGCGSTMYSIPPGQTHVMRTQRKCSSLSRGIPILSDTGLTTSRCSRADTTAYCLPSPTRRSGKHSSKSPARITRKNRASW